MAESRRRSRRSLSSGPGAMRLLLPVLLVAAVSAADPVWLEEGGLLVIDAEDQPAAAGRGFRIASGAAGFLGAGYLEWAGKESTATELPRGWPVVAWHFVISTPGEYQVRVRNLKGEGEKDKNNDIFIALDDDQPRKAYINSMKGAWIWRINNAPRKRLEAGGHRLVVAGRSRGMRLDRFVLTCREDLLAHQGDPAISAAFDPLPLSRSATAPALR